MNIIKKIVIFVLTAVMLLNICGCGKKDDQEVVTKTVKEEVLVPDTKTEKRLVGPRIIGVNKIPREEDLNSDDNNSESSDQDDANDNSDEEEIIRPITDNLIEDNIFAYRVLRSNESTGIVTKAVAQLVKDIKAKLGCTVTYKTDSVKELENQRELIIGLTNRPSSAEAEKKLRANRANCYYDAIICTEGKNICIFAYDADALKVAIDKFLSEFCNGNVKKIPKDYTWIYTSNKSVKSVKLGNDNITKFNIVIPKNPSSLILGVSDLLQSTIEAEAGYPIDIIYDSAKATANEIHIGNTSRSITPQADGYTVKLQNGKLYFTSENEETVFHIVRDFTDNVKLSKNGYSLAENYTKSDTSNSARKEWAGYKLVWYDEFEGTSLNKDNWQATIDTRTSFNGGTIRRQNNDKNIFVSDGYLHCVGYQENVKDFSAGDVKTSNKMYFRYGYIEARYKQAPGNSYAAFWLNSDAGVGGTGSWRPEIDIVETFNSPKNMVVNLHTWANNGDGTGYHVDHGGVLAESNNPMNREWSAYGDSLLSDEFHIYGCEWTPKYISFYVDGELVTKWDITSSDYDGFRNHPTFVQIGHMIGLSSNAVVNPADMLIDYVRLYQRDDSVSGYESFISNGKKPNEVGFEDRTMND